MKIVDILEKIIVTGIIAGGIGFVGIPLNLYLIHSMWLGAIIGSMLIFGLLSAILFATVGLIIVAIKEECPRLSV
ncbi:MAG: hypothetical protein HYV65_01245 [Candidatus Spechtbacteria bacterium]|nr:hypothetical protein [Candidatus Spechtbacteria bacterium]